MLEEEIARLKQELSKRPTSANVRPYPPPPPPPPPPPVLPLPRKNLIRMPTASDDPNLFASARASLKQAPPPVENPINPIIHARRAGIATVGLAPDKMAAFLNEMKTVRLRKTNSSSAMASSARAHENGNATFVAPTPPSRVAQLAPRRSLEGLYQRLLMDEDAPMAPEEWAALRARVRAEMDSDARVGEKRKRVDDPRAPVEETRSGAAKRVSAATKPSAIAATTSASANSSFGSTSTATSTSSVPRGLPRRKSTPLAQPTSSQSRSQTVISQPRAQVQPEPQEYTLPPSPPSPPPSARPAPPAIWQASSVTSAPTPSLCSDNDDVHNDAEHTKQDASDDQVPATPPIGVGVLGGSGPSRSFFRFKGNEVPMDEAELGDRSMRLGRSFTRDADADGSFVGNVDREKDLDTSMRRSARGADVPAHKAMDVGGKSGSAKPKAKTRPLASGIPRLKVRRAPTPPARTPPPPAHEDEQGQDQDHNMEEQQHRTEHENEDEEDRPSTFIRPRGAAPRANISFLAARPPTSPMPAKSPRRPRAPGRISSRGSTSGTAGAGSSASVSAGPPGHTPGVRRVPTSARYEYEDEEYMDEEGGRQGGQGSGLLPSPPLHERMRTPTSGSSRQPASHRRTVPAGPSQTQSRSSQKQTKQPKQSKGKGKAKATTPEQANPAQAKSKTKLKRRSTLDEELRTAVPFLHEDDHNEEEEGEKDAHVDPADAYMAEVAQQDADEVPYQQEGGGEEEEDLDSGVLVGVGTRSKRRGFLAHGGAGGPPVFMGVGYVEGAEEDEEQEQENGPGYAEEEEEEEEEYDDDPGDGDDDDEYLPSPELRARHGGGQRRR
ncbi:hypothetical protein BDN70DRAFT_551191 [Pholiota conissans]|uniref:Uncharacterized protein n=1 Tax=Pholiota conissans TaxID=109636 RepID=A0A9P5YLT6_9AGAR|nr:hypothetical protein BDN70DRAFT_551191 [Pholiota conissans]